MGKTKRNRNVDILRAIAIIIIIVYHIYAVGGYPWAAHDKINTIMSFGGEYGVTLFFLLSGFGIFISLSNKEKSGKFPSWPQFMKSRCIRIMPPYYICLVILLLFQSYNLISIEGIPTILSYVVFCQNFFVSTHGAINGALWALATIFQFYLIAPFIYKFIKKNYVAASIASIIITVASKFIIYNILLKTSDGVAYFVYGRQLISALDNFVLGMTAAVLAEKMKKIKRPIAVFNVFLSIFISCIISYVLSKHGLYLKDFIGYTGHTILAISLMFVICSFAAAPTVNLKIMRLFDWIAKNQYGIYLWHMPIIRILGEGAPLIVAVKGTNFSAYIIIILIISVVIGGFYSRGVDIIVKNKN